MKVVIASDSFKGCLEAIEVAECIEKGIRNVFKGAEIIKKPMADGGEGTVKSLIHATRGSLEIVEVTDPLGQKIESYYGILGNRKTAVIEMASASGLPLVPFKKRNPMITTTYGTGELIKAALDKGCREFILGIGGSATNDGGVGMAQALGGSFLDVKGIEVGYGGGELSKINKIDISGLDKRITQSRFIVACDVDNPLCGSNGAAHVYAAQKGATKEMIFELDNGLKNLSRTIKRDLNIDIENISGSGAAGGLGAGIIAFLNGELKSGVGIIAERIELEEAIKDSDLVITGEGKIDSQTKNGKVPIGVAQIAKKYNVPVIAIAGCISDDSYINHEYGIDAMFSVINYPIDIKNALEKEKASFFIQRSIQEIFRLISSIHNI